MLTSLVLRCFLLLALLLNGLMAAHAALHLPMPLQEQSVQEMATDRAAEGCHNMADRSAQDEQTQGLAMPADCCKGGVCQCICAAQALVTAAELPLSPLAPASIRLALPRFYPSLDPAPILRPPIA